MKPESKAMMATSSPYSVSSIPIFLVFEKKSNSNFTWLGSIPLNYKQTNL